MTDPDLDPVYFLLVDDLEENLLSLDALLRREGVVMLKAQSGEDALELLLKHEVALALLDVQMPGMDGFELAELMRGSERTSRVPIIFLTAGSADRQRRFRGYEAGAVDFLHKPIEPDILRSKADVFFELYRQRQLVARQRDELKSQADALKLADQRKDEFLAVLAHELRNPLAPIRYGLEIIRLSGNAPVEAEMRDMLDRQVTHLVRLIDDLLDISRVSRGKIDLRRQTINFENALQAALETSRPMIDARQHELSVGISEGPLWLNADLTRIAQIFSNLLNNAAKFTPKGGKIHLSARRVNDQAIVSITDNGVGIAKEMLPRVFELFAQVEDGGKPTQGGLGIGLALAQQLIEMHGGSIEVQSDGLGHGSSFIARFPLVSDPIQTLDNPTAVATPAKELRVLVVDDNVSSAETTGQILTMIGHDVSIAHDGPAALDLARRLNPQVILLDIGLPGISGYEVCQELRKDPRFKDTLFIAQTGWGQEKDRQKSREAGFNHHLTKPVNIDELTALLAAH